MSARNPYIGDPREAGGGWDYEEEEDRSSARPGWSRWYHEARSDMAFRYGVRGVPVDLYKEQHAFGRTPQQGVKAIYEEDRERWEKRR